MANKKVLITGADGFIGKYILQKLKRDGYQVNGLALNDGVIDEIKIAGINLLKKEKIESFFKKHPFDAVIHLAAKIPQNFLDLTSKQSFRENILTTLNLLDVFSQSKAKKFIFASSISVYGDCLPKTITEKNLPNPNNYYSASKIICENLCEEYAKLSNKGIVILRISAPYGPGQREDSVVPIFLKKAKNNQNLQIFGSGSRAQDFIYIDDIAECFSKALKFKGHFEIFNLGSGKSTSTKELANIILKILPESKSKIIFTKIDPQENYRLRINISKARKLLDFTPKVSINEGLLKIIKTNENSNYI